MAEPLKNIYTEDFLRLFGERVQTAYSPFDASGFPYLFFPEEPVLRVRGHTVLQT
jgi:hypothetical protein